MSVLVAVTDNKQGQAAYDAAVAEAAHLGTELIALNLTLYPLETADVPGGVSVRVINRQGPGDRDPVDAVMDEIRDNPDISRLVIGIKRRTPVGKALLGSVTQRLLLDVSIPILTVKAP